MCSPRRLVFAVLGCLFGLAGPLVALADRPKDDPFYQPPDPLPKVAHGTLLRWRPFTPLLAPGVPLAARAWQIMYTSTDPAGAPIAVTGIVVVPLMPFFGARPLITWASGTQGSADICDPSYQYATGSEYEAPTVNNVILAGWAIAMTDYQRRRGAAAGDQLYLNGTSEGHAVLDAALAAQQLTDAGISASAPVGIMGYSQGGQAGAFAAELQLTYAPNLNLKGVAVGGIPTRLEPSIGLVEGSIASGFLPLVLVGFNAANPNLHLDDTLTPLGSQAVTDARQNLCTFQIIAKYPLLTSVDLIGEPAVLDRADWLSAFQAQRSGTGVTPAPAFVYGGTNDTVVPFTSTQELFLDWCAHGGDVQLMGVPGTEHLTAFATGEPLAQQFMSDRFSGRPATSGCPP